MINAAVVGLGWWGRQVVGSLQGRSDKIAIVRIADIDPAGARAFAAEKDLPLSADLEQVLDDPKVAAVILTTPHSLHEAQIARVAASGKHVFSEKPLALTKASAERSVAACERAGIVLGIGHERRFERPMVEIRRLVASGGLGTLLHAEANFSHDKFKTLDAGNWRASPQEAPAAGMTGMGIHLTDAYIDMLGPVAELYAQTASRVLALAAGDVVSVQFRFASGATGYIAAISATPYCGRFQVFGADAWVEARDTAHPEVGGTTHLTICRGDGVQETRSFDPFDAVRANFEAFADAIEGRAPYPFTRDQLIHNIAVFEAIVLSARTGKPVGLR